MEEESGPALLLREAWDHLQLPIAITECHLHSTSEDQLRWFHAMWKTADSLRQEGIPVKAITTWALFGLWGWNCLVTKPWGDYEPGVFNVRSGIPRPTALAQFLQDLIQQNRCDHPALQSERGLQLPSLEQALEHYLQAIDYTYPAGRIAV